jgi:hypothetical protein
MKFIASDEHMAMLKYCSSPPQEDGTAGRFACRFPGARYPETGGAENAAVHPGKSFLPAFSASTVSVERQVLGYERRIVTK